MKLHTTAFDEIDPRLKRISTLIMLIWICFTALDIIAYLNGSVSSITIYLKALASFLCASTAFYSWIIHQRRTEDLLRWIGFLLAFCGDIAVLLNTYRIYSDPFVFAIGGYLFIPALLLISIRNARFFAFLKANGAFIKQRVIFALYFYIPFVILIVLLGSSLHSVGLLELGIGYGICLITVLWTGWAAARYKIYGKKSGLLIATGATLVFVMELVGLIYNLHIPGLQDIAFFATWILYVPGMLLMAIA